MNEPACDALVIGGGLQGLWLLKQLCAKGYSAFLCETMRLGEKQTSHAHSFLHQGFAYLERDSIRTYQKAWREHWQDWLRAQQLLRADPPSYHLFFPGAERQFRDSLASGLWTKDDVQPALAIPGLNLPDGGGFYRTREHCISANILVERFQQENSDCIRRVKRVQQIQLTTDGDKVERVDVEIDGQGTRALRPKAVLLAAGGANGDLQRLIKPVKFDAVSHESQPTLDMIVVKGPGLPEYNGSIAGIQRTRSMRLNFFVVSRSVEPGQRVVLFNGTFLGSEAPRDRSEALDIAIAEIEKLFPAISASRHDLHWKGYRASIIRIPKVEPGRNASRHGRRSLSCSSRGA